MPENISIQQQRTEKVAPVLMALLEAKNVTQASGFSYDDSLNIARYEGTETLITFDGKQLTLWDKQTRLEKMIATGSRNPNTGDIQWKAQHLPHLGNGLSAADVHRIANPKVISIIKETLLKAHQQECQKEQLATLNNGNGHRLRGR